ncbi:MAG: hypothetical protein AAF528_05955 [Cyanobacteria bacterium P01_C01_bin.121]
MKVSDFQHKNKKWNCFAVTDTLGSFDFYTSIVSLDSLTSTDVTIAQQKLLEFFRKQANDSGIVLDADSYHQIAKVFPLAVHEYTHFIDATSTLWGLRHLKMMKEAYEANDALGGTESDFYKAKKYYDYIRMLRLPKYYTLRNTNSSNTTPWQYEFSAGLLFDSEGRSSDRTIVFTRFLNSSGDFLVRSPISSVSLLEMSAMAQEVLMNILLLTNTDNDFRAVEGALYSQRLMQYLYNPDITEYSVCVHLVANSLNLTDPAMAFRICAVLISVILNIPTGYFSTIAASCPIADILKAPSNHQSIKYFRNGLSLCDYGTLFYLLCRSLPKGDYTSTQSIQTFVESSIERVGINIIEMQSKATLEADELHQQLKTAIIPEIVQLAEAGYANFKKIGYNRENLPFEQLNLPPVLLSDSTSSIIFPNIRNRLSTFDIDSAFATLYECGQAWVERFSEACV